MIKNAAVRSSWLFRFMQSVSIGWIEAVGISFQYHNRHEDGSDKQCHYRISRKVGNYLLLVIAYLCVSVMARASSVTLEVAGSVARGYGTIQEAIYAAPANATVRIGPGRYEENLVVTSPLTLAGPGWDQATVGFLPAKTGDELTSLGVSLQANMRNTASPEASRRRYNELMDSVYPPALALRSAGEVNVAGLRFTQIPKPGSPLAKIPISEQILAPLNAVWVTTSALTMTDCAVVGSVTAGVVAGSGSVLNLRHCLVAGVFGDGVVFASNSSGSVKNSDVRSCYHYGIAIGPRTKNVFVENCRISDTAWHGIRMDDCHAIVRNNRIYNHARCGLYVSGKTSAELSDNQVYNCGSGISFYGDCRDVVRHNTFADCDIAIILASGAGPEISQNLFTRNKAGVTSDQILAQFGSQAIKANQVWQTGRGKGQLDWAPETSFLEPQWKNAAHLEVADDTSTCGARVVAEQASPFPLQAEEKAILPTSASRSFSLWVPPEKAWGGGSAAREVMDVQPRASATTASVSAQSYQESFGDLYEKLGRNYPCFQLKGIDWKAVGDELIPRARKVANDDQFGRLVMELVARLQDTHAEVLPGSIPLPRIEFPSWSPGCVCLMAKDGKAAVYSVTEGSPAALAGIRPGMVVKQVHGVPADVAISATGYKLRKYYGYSSPQIIEYDAVRAMLNVQEAGTTFTVDVEGRDGSTSAILLVATEKVGYLPRLPVPIPGISDSADVSWKKMAEGVGYIYVRRIRNGLEAKLDTALTDLRGVNGLIIDVRGNSGGGFDTKTALANFDPATTDTSRPKFEGPIAVLIDSRCVSAGEGWASWFVANKRAAFFGERTAGASSRKIVYDLKNGLYKVRIPVKAFSGFLNRPIERRGLEPDVEVRPSAEDLALGRDTVLQTALDYIKQKH